MIASLIARVRDQSGSHDRRGEPLTVRSDRARNVSVRNQHCRFIRVAGLNPDALTMRVNPIQDVRYRFKRSEAVVHGPPGKTAAPGKEGLAEKLQMSTPEEPKLPPPDPDPDWNPPGPSPVREPEEPGPDVFDPGSEPLPA